MRTISHLSRRNFKSLKILKKFESLAILFLFTTQEVKFEGQVYNFNW